MKSTILLLLVAQLAAQAQSAPTARENAAYSSAIEPIRTVGKKLVKNVLLDQKAIWTSPLHMKQRNVKWALLFGTATAGLIASDRWTARQLPNTADQIRLSDRVSKLGSVYTLLPLTAGFYLTGVLTDNAKARETGVLGAEALADGLILSQGIKFIAGRQRPYQADGGGHFFHGGHSFPSGHTMESFTLAAVIAHEYPTKKVAFLAYGIAGLVSASRFSSRQHFASDIVVPAVVGWLIGSYVVERHQAAAAAHQKIRAILTPQLGASVQPQAHRYGVTLDWHR